MIRAKYDLSVFKDGTVRFDSTNAVLSHFRPIEVSVSVEKLKEIGYENDCNMNPLIDDNQLCAIHHQDVVISKTCADYIVKVTKFIDELLIKFSQILL